MNIINLTPHTINIFRSGLAGPEPVVNIPPSGQVARLEVSRQETANLIHVNGDEVCDPQDAFGGVALYKSVFGNPVLMEGDKEVPFPEEKPNILYVVSSLFRSGFDRPDLYVPGELVRDSDGRPIGCKGLSR